MQEEREIIAKEVRRRNKTYKEEIEKKWEVFLDSLKPTGIPESLVLFVEMAYFTGLGDQQKIVIGALAKGQNTEEMMSEVMSSCSYHSAACMRVMDVVDKIEKDVRRHHEQNKTNGK